MECQEFKNKSFYEVLGLDLLNNTPVISVSPYQTKWDLPHAGGGWMQEDAENQSLIPLHYDKSNQKQTFGEVFENKYSIVNFEQFKKEFEFIQNHLKINVQQFVCNQLERVPVLTRTHKIVDKQE